MNNFKKFQKDSSNTQSKIFRKLGKTCDSPYILLSYLLAECGEVADRVRALEGNRIKSSSVTKNELAKEIVDSVYNLMLIANYFKIDLDKYWDKRLKKINEKFK